MGFFDGFLDTASSAFNWLGNNKTALDMISGAAKGYGAYMQYKQSAQQNKMMQQQMDDANRRWDQTHGTINSYDNSVPGLQTQNTSLISGNMANAMKGASQ